MVLTSEPFLPDNTPLLLLRGLTREQRHWGEFLPILAAKAPNPWF